MNNTLFEDKDISVSKAKHPLKKAYSIYNKTFVFIDDSLVKELVIDENNTWFEQEKIENGIMLRICRFPFSRDK